MNSHLDAFSGDLRKSVKDVQFASNSEHQQAAHRLYTDGAIQRPSATISQMDSIRSDDSDLGSPDYMSDVSSGAPEIVVWSGEVERDGMDSDEDGMSSPDAIPE